MEHVLQQHFAKLGTIGIERDGSISRLAYSDAESAAMAYVRAEGERFGLEGRYDPIGNLILAWPRAAERRLLVGSHLDSVPHGGNYDGAAGVVCGLEAIRELMADGNGRGEVGIDLVVWRGEEYTFNAVYKGSAAAFGHSEPHILHNLYDGRSLREAIRRQGFDPSYIDECRPSFDEAYRASLCGYLELHIEQGVRLEREGSDVGIVTSICGDRRYLVVLEGRFDHSGATPMGVRYRNDVNLAMAYIQTRIDALAAEQRAAGREFVQTVGIVNADPEIDKKYPAVHGNSVTKVSGLGYFTLDLMSPDDSFMDDYAAELHRLIWATAKEFGVTAVIEQTDNSPGLPRLDAGFQDAIERSAADLGYGNLRLPSGAGHDGVMVARSRGRGGEPIPVGMIFVPCRGGISHSRDEFVEPRHLERGTEVLRDSLRAIGSAAAVA